MLLILDNYDSFTWNLVHYLGETMTAENGFSPKRIRVIRNDDMAVCDVIDMAPHAIVISPGPCTPDQAGIGLKLAEAALALEIPMLGVCLGHQIIAQACGGAVIRAHIPMHGKTSEITFVREGLFENVGTKTIESDPKSGLNLDINSVESNLGITSVTRYHSLVVDPASLPNCFKILAQHSPLSTNDQIIMAIQHRSKPAYGVQFHPESLHTQGGKTLLKNFLNIANCTQRSFK